MTRRYDSPKAFKQALEQRLKSSAIDGEHLARKRQIIVFERFLARATHVFGEDVTLKGGLVLELRLQSARTTKDVDLRVGGDPETTLDHLRRAGQLNLDDFMRFEVRPDPRHPIIQNDGMRYEGLRYRAECRIGDKIYGRPFGIDIAYGDPLVSEPDRVTAPDSLSFAGIEPPTLRLYPVVSHLAEKLHAYTMPRERPNSRVKDLPDIGLLAKTGPIDASELRVALDATFRFRHTHDVPISLPKPPPSWSPTYLEIAAESELMWPALFDAYEAAAAFFDPVLSGEAKVGTWDMSSWKWIRD